MKTGIVFGLVVPALASSTADARDPDDPKPAIGPAFGLTFASSIPIASYGDYARVNGALTRPAIGMSARVPVRGPWQFLPELYYTQFGSRIGSVGVAHHMLAVPLLARFDAVRHKPITPFILAGGQIAFRLKSVPVSTFSPYSYVGYATKSLIPLDAGPVVGFGMEIPIKNVEAHISFRYFVSGVPSTGIYGLELRQQAGVFGGIYF